MAQNDTSPRVYHLLLLCLLLSFPLHALRKTLDIGGDLLAISNAVTILGCLLALSGRGRERVVAWVLGLPAVGLLLVRVASVDGKYDGFSLGSSLLSLALFAFMIIVLLRRLLKAGRTDLASISGMLSIYLLIGLFWAEGYQVVDYLEPHESFAFGDAITGEQDTALFYFSFVTLSTLGFGDVTPASPMAMSLATLEAIVGQLFLVVVVAGTVAKVVSREEREDPPVGGASAS